jgi:hypothetical protein
MTDGGILGAPRNVGSFRELLLQWRIPGRSSSQVVATSLWEKDVSLGQFRPSRRKKRKGKLTRFAASAEGEERSSKVSGMGPEIQAEFANPFELF